MELVWVAPPPHLNLSKKDVHIWRAALDLPSSRVEELEEKLSFDERIRADRLRFERDRNRFIVRLGILREILSFYVGAYPERRRS